MLVRVNLRAFAVSKKILKTAVSLRYCILLATIFLGWKTPAFSSQTSESFFYTALGDSTTTGMNSIGIGSRFDASWATGLKSSGVFSHYERLQEMYPEKLIKAYNSAVPGAQSDDLMRQVLEISEEDIPDYVTIMMGSNDVCQWPLDFQQGAENLEANIDSTIRAIIEKNDQVKILLVPVPNLHRLWQMNNTWSCQWRWDLLGICSNLLHSSVPELERDVFKTKIATANDILEKVAFQYEDNVLFVRSLFDIEFKPEHISSIDCFHPSGKGQDFIASHTWTTGWFADEPTDTTDTVTDK